ncbi:hypothetical protein ACFOPX_05900 [Helicobacter baculiformis]|uniref:Ancestral polypeptide n=1 Tax=Helicobacter baculiformis TaxID=427351 RepID=A0ABV7ZKP0_9HELI|nr:hypothetical protein [Helicobacter baculiformis]
MPLPFILWGAAALAAGYGIKKGMDAHDDMQEIKKLHEEAKSKHDKAKHNLGNMQNQARNTFESLGELQYAITLTSVEKYKEIIDRLQVAHDQGWLQVFGQESMDHLKRVETSIVDLETAIGGALAGVGAGAMAGFGAWGAIGLLGSASTGTAISALSGAAATNATLAWLGGGSLASGGFGIAGGTIAFGGLIAAPVIAVTASVFAAKVAEKKEEAKAYSESVLAVCETMKAMGLTWKHIKYKSIEKCRTLVKLDTHFERKVTRACRGIYGG